MNLFKCTKDNPNIVVKEKVQNTHNGGKVTLSIRKYARNVFYKNLWNQVPEALKSRGVVFDAMTGVQLVYPMDKCFNYLENDVGKRLKDTKKVVAYKKLNGFMVNLTYNSSIGWIVSTTGDALVLGNEATCTNKYLLMASESITEEVKQYYLDLSEMEDLVDCKYTVTFELCHKDDPHIVVEQLGLHPLCVQADSGLHIPLKNDLTSPIKTTLGDLKRILLNVEHEGFMVYDPSGKLLFKMKSSYYLAKKWIQRRNSNMVWSEVYKERLDEEYYPIVEFIRKGWSKEDWDSFNEEQKSEIFLCAYRSVIAIIGTSNG